MSDAFYGSYNWGEGWLLGKTGFVALSLIMKFQIITSEASPGGAEHPTLQRKMEHLSFTVNPDTSWGLNGEGMNHPQEGYLFSIPFSTLFASWWLF